jgi:hypothetical protein
MRACWNLKSTFDFGRTRNGAPASCATGGSFAFEGEASSPLQQLTTERWFELRLQVACAHEQTQTREKLGVADCVLEVENLTLNLRMISKSSAYPTTVSFVQVAAPLAATNSARKSICCGCSEDT